MKSSDVLTVAHHVVEPTIITAIGSGARAAVDNS